MEFDFAHKNSNEMTQIYNLQYEKKEGQFYIQFKQLIAYYNYRRKFKEALKNGYYTLKQYSKEKESIYVQNEFCLIDREWIEQWRRHVGYEELAEFCKKNQIKKELDKNDYQMIIPIIEKNA